MDVTINVGQLKESDKEEHLGHPIMIMDTPPPVVEGPQHIDQALPSHVYADIIPQIAHLSLEQPIEEYQAKRTADLHRNGFTFNWINTNSEYAKLIEHCQWAIDRNYQPTRISAGSSGSYFIQDDKGNVIGIFKPKDEEPYGNLNPKWIKWLHRTCCPCLFGRSFLMPNTGYISEAAASLVDSFLGLDVVPKTQIAHLRSGAFHYPWWEHYRVWRGRNLSTPSQYTMKIGSFQLYVQGFEESETVLNRMRQMSKIDSELQRMYLLEFQKMTILDYVIRNTDRTMDNWLIHFSWKEVNSAYEQEVGRHSMIENSTKINDFEGRNFSQGDVAERERRVPRVKIACIDNGLAFPFNHPHELRSYPYSWSTLPESQQAYLAEIKELLLDKIANPESWEHLIGRLKLIFQIDLDFTEFIFRRQMALLRGQLHNVILSLQANESPSQLLERTHVLIDEETVQSGKGGDRKIRHVRVDEKPLFSCC